MERLYYLCSENKGADQLGGYREADLRLCFCICKKPVFSQQGSYSKIGVYRGIHYFLIFALKHRLLVLVRNASMRLQSTHHFVGFMTVQLLYSVNFLSGNHVKANMGSFSLFVQTAM